MAAKKRTKKLSEQYVLTRDEMQALVDFAKEVSGLVMSPHGRDIEVEGYLSTTVCDRADKVFQNHGIRKL